MNGAAVVSTSKVNMDMCWYWQWQNTNITPHSLQKCAVYAHTKIYNNWSININSNDDL